MQKAMPEVLINIEKMEEAFASEVFTMPTGLTREQKRQYIKDCANGKIKGDSNVRQTKQS